MAHPHVDFPTKLIQLLVSNRSAFVVITSFFIFKDVLKVEFACPCTSSGPVKEFCIYFAALPCLSFFLLFILIDTRCMRIFGCYDGMATCCSEKAIKQRNHHWCVAFERVVKGSCVASMWLVTLLNDGDWFVCISTPNINSTAGQLHIACMDKEKLTQEEILILRFLENESRIISLGFILIIVLAWANIELAYH
ncbi:hypothetical protein GJAV_G00210850 [Gymnothorax javanicus]|nr:hypothetical protein GJAV_G00210850 [Gymnothorax javanicus]